MSDLARTDQTPAHAAAAQPHPYEDEQMRRLLRRNQIVAATIARMTGLNPSLVGETIQETQANVEAVGLGLAVYGINLNPINVNQFDQIPPKSGQMVPRCQLLMALVSELTGDEIWPDEDNDDTHATTYLKRADTGRVYKATYTLDQARRSHALDFTFEEWKESAGGKRYMAQRVVMGTDYDEVFAKRASWPTWARGEPKYNPAWHFFREDMLARRSFKRVIKAGRPGVTAGVLVFDQPRQLPPMPPGATVTVNMDFDDEQAAIEAGAVDVDEQDAAVILGTPGAPVRATDEVKKRLAAAIQSLAPEQRHLLVTRWQAMELPPLTHADFDTTDAVDASQLVLDVMATPVDQEQAGHGGGVTATNPPPPQAASGVSSAPETGRAKVSTAAGEGTGAEGSADRKAHPQSPSSDEPARPLAQQIAMQAQAAGVEHHRVIAAVTGGTKASAKDVDVEEGQLTLQAIAAIARGEYMVVEKDGAWVFEDTPRYAPGEEPFD